MKKTVLFFCTCLFMSAAAEAQIDTIVSTNPQNKNAVLEIYTGRNCTFCPDGQEVADNLVTQNPGRVIKVNVHGGGFAPTSYPNYRINDGQALVAASNASGFPAGSVNRRRDFPVSYQNNGFAMSRGDWPSSVSTTLNETSIANVGIEAVYDDNTNSIDIEVQVYYTDDAVNPTNRLVVGVVQSNIIGPQIGANRYPAKVLPDGRYVHDRMLRDFITGHFGETVSPTTQGTLISKTYNWPVPDQIVDVPVDLTQLEFVAYIAEGQEDIISGVETEVDFPNSDFTDMAFENNTSVDDYCFSDFEPTLSVTNNGQDPITSFDVDYTLNGGTAQTYSFSGNIGQGATENVSLGTVGVINGTNVLSVSRPYNINNGALLDNQPLNDLLPDIEVIKASSGNSLPYSEDFESAPHAGTAPSLYDYNRDGLPMYVVDNTAGGTSVSWNLGGYEESPMAYRFRMYSFPQGHTAAIVSDNYDFSETVISEMIFDYAYGQLTAGESSSLSVEFSTDCGKTWSAVWTKSGNNLATAPANNQDVFYPRKEHWRTDTVDISAYDEAPDVMFRFKVVSSGNGNSIYLDNIKVQGTPVGINHLSSREHIKVYPNPTSSNATVEIKTDNKQLLNIEVFDALGQMVLNGQQRNIHSGINQIQLNTNNLTPGMYFVSVRNQNGDRTVKQLMVK